MKDRGKPTARRRRWILLAGAFLVLILIIGFTASMLVDPESFRGRIERGLTDATGWSCEIGEIDFSIWKGSLSVAPARLHDPRGESAVDVERISIRVALFRLLRGDLAIRSVTLHKPNVTLVKGAGTEEWPMPGKPSSTSSSQPQQTDDTDGTPDATGSSAVVSENETAKGPTISVVRLIRGHVTLDDRNATTPSLVTLEDVVVAWHVEQDRFEGSAGLPDDGGRVRVEGDPQGPFSITLEKIDARLLEPWLGSGLFVGETRIDGMIDIDWPSSVAGEIEVRPLLMLDGIEPLEDVRADFTLVTEDGQLMLDRVEIEGSGVRIVGSGRVQPVMDLHLSLEETSLESLILWSDAVMPLPVPVSPPGSMTATFALRTKGDGSVVLTGAGQLHAAEVTPGNPLPALHDVRAEFELDETGQLTTRVIDATVAGGKLLGQADLDAIAPPGLLSFDGEVEAAVLGKLIGGFMADPDSEILGVTALDLDLGLDLSGELDASALRGGLSILSTEVDLPGWDLENAVREGVEAKLASLGALQDLLGDRDDTPSDDSEETADETGEPPLIDQLAATIAFGSMPWEISHLLLAAGDLISEGRGTFDPLQDHLDLAIVAKFSPERSARWLEEYGELEALQDSEGRISLPVLIQGSVVAPDVSVDASQLRKSKRKQLKKKLLERLLR